MSNTLGHPGKIVSPELIDLIKEHVPAAERSGSLHPEQLEIIYEQKWFNLFVPKEYGGLELDLPGALQIEESLAYVDGSLGWTVTLCSGANWFVGFLEKEIAQELFANRKVCFAGSGRPSGIATVKGNGYEVTGLWKYATGAPHATVFTANCLVKENGELLKNENGDPLVRTFWFKKDEVLIHNDWNCIGMIATASHSFEVSQLFVEKNRTFVIESEYSFHNNPVYKYPFLQFAETTLAVNSSGMAACFLDLCEKIFEEKKNGDVKSKDVANERLGIAKRRLFNAREVFYSIVDRSWNELLLVGTNHANLLFQVSEVSRALAKIAREEVDGLYPYCGILAANPETEINRVWRNIHTASQHSLLL